MFIYQFYFIKWMKCSQIKSLQSGKIIQVSENKVEVILNSYSADAFWVL